MKYVLIFRKKRDAIRLLESVTLSYFGVTPLATCA